MSIKTLKYCYYCKETKPIELFSKNRAKPDGLACECLLCSKILRKIYRSKNKDKLNKKIRIYRKNNKDRIQLTSARYWRSEQGKKIKKKSAAKYYQNHKKETLARSYEYRKKHPIKYKAHWLITYGIKTGEIVRPATCQDCGIICNVHAHHENYDKPLEVEWLCRGCHGKRHRQKPLVAAISF